jgi:two-component system LytT family response regulator
MVELAVVGARAGVRAHLRGATLASWAPALLLYVTIAAVRYVSEVGGRLREQEARAARAEALQARAEMQALRAQINPHFMFNTLHLLLELVSAGDGRAEEAIERFGALLHRTCDVRRSAADDVPLDEEIQLVRDYLWIEQLRLGTRLRAALEVDDDALRCTVPSFVLQPLVENAVKHAASMRVAPTSIRVRAAREGGRLLLSVEDDGPGAIPERVECGTGRGAAAGARATGGALRGCGADADHHGAGGGVPRGARAPGRRARAGGGGARVSAMALRTVVAEDEPLARQRLRRFVERDPRLLLVGEAESGTAAVELIDRLAPDVVFLDVQMPECTGLEVLERAAHRPAPVFTTAYPEYALRAFEVEAYDYLVKPFGWTRFQAAVDRVARRLAAPPASAPAAEPYLERLFVRRRGEMVPVSMRDVHRIEGAGDYVTLCTDAGQVLADISLNELERRLDPASFRRVHRAHIVNLDHVSAIRPYDERRLSVRFADGSEVVASRAGSQSLREMVR